MAGCVAVWLDGRDLHVSNTGAPLNIEGVQALAALRASGKSADAGVGQFGVGFTAVLAVSDEIELRSVSGSIRFSAAQTRELLARSDIPAASRVPVLRLVWPTLDRPVEGADTEIVLRLRDGVDAVALLAAMRSEAVDLLLELPALESIRIGDDEFRRTQRAFSAGVDEISIGDQNWLQYQTPRARWLVPVVGERVSPVGSDVLRAPTRSDEELSLPALLIADVRMQPDRRRVLPGARIAELAAGYSEFVRALPAPDRIAMVPVPSLGRSAVDSILREAIIAELRESAWVPVIGDDEVAIPTRATVLPGLTSELASVLAEVIPDLVRPEVSGQHQLAALAQVDVHRIGLARVAELLSGLQRSPRWWHELYAALDGLVIDSVAAEELGSIAVPLADGRTVTGPRTTVTADSLELIENDSTTTLPVHWARLVHPAASHPLLGRLGSRHVDAADLLADPALQSAIEDVHDDEADELADAVLALAAKVSDPSTLPSWLGLLPLPDTDGELRSADELLLPGAPLHDVLVDESPFGTIDRALVERFGGEALRAVGVGWTFSVIRDELPTGPDHDLDDEVSWWSTLTSDPDTLVAVRDLDLVDDHRWPQALSLLAQDSVTAPLLRDRDGYVAWWLRRHASVDGQRLGALRYVGDATFDGVLDALVHPHAEALRGVLAAADDLDAELVQVIVDQLAEPARTPTPAVVADIYRRLGAAVASGVVDAEQVGLPDGVRTLSGAVVDPATALVLDKPWFAAVVPLDRLVVGSIETSSSLAQLLDLPVASESITGEIVGEGSVSSWDREPLAVLFFVGLGLPCPVGEVVVHDELTVRFSGAVDGCASVPFWVTDAGVTHVRANWTTAQ